MPGGRAIVFFLFCLLANSGFSQEYPSDSTKDGVYYVLGDSNQVILKGAFKDTVRVGIWREYDAQGIISKKYKYKKGKVRWMKIYRSGILYQTIDRKGRIYTKSDCGC